MAVIRDRLIKGDAKNYATYIVEAHEAYKLYINRWQFLQDSYNGGFEYFHGKYLEPYYYESRDDYEKRLRMVGLDNHVKSVANIYNSFLFKKDPVRNLGSLDTDPTVPNFMDDADLDGRSYKQFLMDVATWMQVYGNVWIIVDKVNTNAMTRAEELQQNVRPYVSMFHPLDVLDWEYTRGPNGFYELTYLKVKEEVIQNTQYVREYTPTEINIYKISGEDRKGEYVMTLPNELGKVPAACLYAQRSQVRGIGVSSLGDTADIQKEIYEFHSEIEQIVRLTNHPSLVKTADTEASAGAGAIIQMPQNLDGNLKPFLLQPNGSSIESVLKAIEKKVDSIDRTNHLAGLRSVDSRRLSGIAISSEFTQLSSRLATFATQLEHAEEQIWRLYALYEGTVFDGTIEYPRSFSIQDKANDISLLKMAKDSNINNQFINDEIDKKLYKTIMEDEAMDIPEQQAQPLQTEMTHPPLENVNALVTHMREMIEQGYTNEQIVELHPEMAKFFNNTDPADNNI
jgi:hypothetical protein|tara:strand:- start:7028 stop:8563 length:1536 start_codon:yes stop_codon:yes gene_type:complete